VLSEVAGKIHNFLQVKKLGVLGRHDIIVSLLYRPTR